ncbi:MerR family transcriptional regulator [Thermoactinospora rubra]|uniref:MerR family transcriptional regulator n=1 Tax=Thermoactinospora rubra TaxID=1088767 RepID=UPI000A11706E|nr:MerR family transcriptional regulator [Thermoactinospora rubra]
MTDQEQQGYGIGAVSRRLGVPSATLRTWNLRYGIGPSRRSPGGHRRYGEDDLRRLEEMNRLIHAGMPPAEAARRALLSTTSSVQPVPAEERASPGPMGLDAGHPAGGGVPSAAMMARAAAALDGRAVAEGLAAALARHGVVWTWDRLVRPAFETICRRQAASGADVDIEHLFSDQVLAALHGLARRPAEPANARLVLLACAEEEQHSLPVHALAATLATEHRVEGRVLGARTPYAALADAMRRLGPAVVFVYSQLAATGDPLPLTRLPSLRPPCRVLVGGPGWPELLPARLTRVTSLRAAAEWIAGALGVPPGGGAGAAPRR